MHDRQTDAAQTDREAASALFEGEWDRGRTAFEEPEAADPAEIGPAARDADPADQPGDRDVADAAQEAEAPASGGFWRRAAIWVAALTVIAGVLDAASTELALATGKAWEANPFVRALQAEIGSYWVVPKMIVHGALAAVILAFPRPFTLIVLGTLGLVTLAAAINNFDIYFDIVAAA